MSGAETDAEQTVVRYNDWFEQKAHKALQQNIQENQPKPMSN
jgi:hypothetical protein